MWYLSRTPNFSSSQVVSRTSIFSVSDTGSYLEDLSFVITPNDDDEEKQDDQQHNCGNPCQWFTYEYAPTQFIGVAVPRKTQIISVMPDYFVCARVIPKAKQGTYARLCTYSRKGKGLVDVPSCMELKEGYVRDLLTAACALLDGWLYVAGGYKVINNASSDAEVLSSSKLRSAERLNLATLQWETLPSTIKPQAYATGIACKGLFFCIGDDNNKHSAQIFHPKLKLWRYVNNFIPEEADGYAVRSVDGVMVLITWSTFCGIKLWRWVDNVIGTGTWMLAKFYADNKVARSWLDQGGVKLVRIKSHLFIMVGLNCHFCWVDGSCAWPVLPAPSYSICEDGQKVENSGKVHGFRLRRNGPSWRLYPVYRLGSQV